MAMTFLARKRSKMTSGKHHRAEICAGGRQSMMSAHRPENIFLALLQNEGLTNASLL